MDALSALLRTLKLTASVFFHSDFCGEWYVDTSGSAKATFHVVTQGRCQLSRPTTDEVITLNSGDLVLFPRDAQHEIRNISSSTMDVQTHLVCGYFEFEPGRWNPILESLPEAVIIQPRDTSGGAFVRAIIQLVNYELSEPRLGVDVAVDRLCDALFIYVIRNFIAQNPSTAQYFTALGDKAVGSALLAIHEETDGSLDTVALAETAGLSRSSFSERFTKLVGTSPGFYLTRWRMERAYEKLSTGTSVIDVALGAGYSSEAAFSKAFKATYSVGPGHVRRNGGGNPLTSESG